MFGSYWTAGASLWTRARSPHVFLALSSLTSYLSLLSLRFIAVAFAFVCVSPPEFRSYVGINARTKCGLVRRVQHQVRQSLCFLVLPGI